VECVEALVEGGVSSNSNDVVTKWS
jgi:hypothetical protein